MPSTVPIAPERPPRRARYLVPLGTPRRGEALAAAAVAAVVAGVLFAPLTLLLAALSDAVSRATRWRPLWLTVPAAGGLVWVLAIGPGNAVAGLRRGPAAALSALATGPAGLARLPGLAVRGLPGQVPLALILAAAAAAAAWWLRWLHTDEWDTPAERPGLVSLIRRRQAGASLRAGRVLTRDGVRLGVEPGTGRAAAMSWRDAGGGVLVTGAAPPAVLATGLQLAHAAIRRRKPVIVVDLTGDRDLPGALAALCAAARAPLHEFGAPGGPRYEPRVRPRPEQHAALAGVPWGPRDGSPVAGQGGNIADTALAAVAWGTQDGGQVARWGGTIADVVRQRGVALFALAGPATGAATGAAAGVLAGLVAADVAGLYLSLYRAGTAPDGLCWLTECDGVDPAALAGLIAAGSPAGLATVLATTAPEPAARVAGQVNAGIFHRLADPGLAARLAPLTGTTVVPLARVLGEPGPASEDGGAPPAGASHAVPLGTMAVPVVQAASLCALSSRDFVLITGMAAARAGGAAAIVRAPCRAVPVPVPGRPEPPPGDLPVPWRPA